MRKIGIDDSQFVDEHGRILMLRGVNLGGSTKVPPKFPSHQKYQFYANKFSFLGRPFPLKEADEHFSRLKNWGFRFIRFLVTWEAIEPHAPGEYDEEYLEYVRKILEKAQEYGLQVFIDPHQDVWSRYSGGDGAPKWTFEKIGLKPEQFHEAEAAILHQAEQDQLEEMIWPTNYTKMAAATMFTIFFGGNDFTPNLEIEGQRAQDYLQEHYFRAMEKLAEKLLGLKNIVGFDTMNEPSSGWIAWPDLSSNEHPYRRGKSPSPFEAMVLAAGNPMKVENWVLSRKGPKKGAKIEANPRGIKAWRNGFNCLWKELGVWNIDEMGTPQLLKPHYFRELEGRKVNFNQDYLWPFMQKYAQRMRKIHPQALIFIEFPPMDINLQAGDSYQIDTSDYPYLVHAAHWYDALTLFRKKFSPWFGFDIHKKKSVFGKKRVRRLFVEQLAKIKKETAERLLGIPTVIGEIGIPYDMNAKRAYSNGNFKSQLKAIDTNFRALEANFLSLTWWNYTADNNNEYGDQWNKEDLSIFSRDQQDNPEDIHSGGRALKALLRPYPVATAGVPIRLEFDYQKSIFEFEFEHVDGLHQATEIYVPSFHFPNAYKVQVSDGNYEINEEESLLIYQHSVERYRHQIRISPA